MQALRSRVRFDDGVAEAMGAAAPAPHVYSVRGSDNAVVPAGRPLTTLLTRFPARCSQPVLTLRSFTKTPLFCCVMLSSLRVALRVKRPRACVRPIAACTARGAGRQKVSKVVEIADTAECAGLAVPAMVLIVQRTGQSFA